MELGDREESQNVEDERGKGRTGLVLGGGGIVIVLIALFLGVYPQKIMNLLGQQQGPDGAAQEENVLVDPAEEPLRRMVQKHLLDGYSTARTYVLPSNAIHCPANIDAGDRAFCTLAKG